MNLKNVLSLLRSISNYIIHTVFIKLNNLIDSFLYTFRHNHGGGINEGFKSFHLYTY